MAKVKTNQYGQYLALATEVVVVVRAVLWQAICFVCFYAFYFMLLFIRKWDTHKQKKQGETFKSSVLLLVSLYDLRFFIYLYVFLIIK
jgi:hypothetical protein